MAEVAQGYRSMEQMMADKMPPQDLIETYKTRPGGVQEAHKLPDEQRVQWFDNLMISFPHKNIRRVVFVYDDRTLIWNIGQSVVEKSANGDKEMRPVGIDKAHVRPRHERAVWLSDFLNSVPGLKETKCQYVEVTYEKDSTF